MTPPPCESHVLHRSLGRTPPVISHGRGVYLYDRDGKRYLDACGGAAVSCLGHADAEVNAAITAQIGQVAYVHSSFFTSDATEALADRLIEKAGGSMCSALFVSSGSEAMEAALKMARQVHLENEQPGRKHIIARRLSYHGTTLGALAVGGLDNRKAPFAHAFNGQNCSHVSACYPYRYRLPDESSEAFVTRLAAELEQEIQRVGPQNVAAFVAETVMGATVGVVPPPPGYFSAMRTVCDRYGVLMVLDEVMCGMGRCGQWFAYQDEGIKPDIVCVAKGLGGGFQPIGAMLINRRVRDAMTRGSGSFMHGQTYMGHATACAGACAVIDKIDRTGLIGHVRDMGDLLQRRLQDRLADHDHVGEIRGKGLFRAIELVRDRQSRAPFPAALKLNARVKTHALTKGLLCYPGGGALPGGLGDHIVIAPPYIVTAQQIDRIADILAASLSAALRDCTAQDTTSRIDT